MYAKTTKVPVERTQQEIKKVLEKYKAQGFAFGESGEVGMVMFEMAGRRIKFALPLYIYGKARDRKGWLMDEQGVRQENRRRWRCLLLGIKAKLECVESGITTLEQEFLANILLPSGKTVGDEIKPQIAMSYNTGKMPPLLGLG